MSGTFFMMLSEFFAASAMFYATAARMYRTPAAVFCFLLLFFYMTVRHNCVHKYIAVFLYIDRSGLTGVIGVFTIP